MVLSPVVRTASLLWLICIVVPGIASAQDEAAPSASAAGVSDTTPPEAVEFYRRARESYDAGRYREAADDLERALMLDPASPTLVYNLARVYELLGDLNRALQYYERYQRLLPEQQAREQDRAAATIRRLQGAQESDQMEAPAPPVEVEPLRQLPGLVLVRERGVADTAFWVTLTGGVALLAVGAVFGSLALVERQSATDFVLDGTNDPSQRSGALDRAHTYGYVTDGALGAGAIAVVAAGLLYFLREQTVERAPVRAVDPDGDHAAERASVDATIASDGRSAMLVAVGRF